MTDHSEMLKWLCSHTEALARIFGTDRIHVRAVEMPMGKQGERIDIVCQNRSIHSTSPDTTCFVIEAKATEPADHRVLGQLKKANEAMTLVGKATRHWQRVISVCVAKRYTESGEDMLMASEVVPILWLEDEKGIEIRPTTGYQELFNRTAREDSPE